MAARTGSVNGAVSGDRSHVSDIPAKEEDRVGLLAEQALAVQRANDEVARPELEARRVTANEEDDEPGCCERVGVCLCCLFVSAMCIIGFCDK